MKRNAYFDNAKLLLIFLVVFGHAIQPFVSESNSIGTLYMWIYTFHMPAFIFLAGFFAKGGGTIRYIANLAKRLLIPYVIFQILYTGYYFIIGKNNWLTEHIFYPHWSLWFLVSLFCWHMLLILYKRMPIYSGISIALLSGILIGYFDNVEHTFSLSRTFVFFPFFLLGFHVTIEQIQWLKQRSVKLIALITIVLFAIIIYYLPNINAGWLLASKSYQSLGLDYLDGLARLSVYATSTITAASILSLISKHRFSFTHLGERTLYVYLLHGFFIQYFREANLFEVTNLFGVSGMAFLSALIVFALANRFIVTIWQPLIEISTVRLQNYFRELKHLFNV